MSVGLVATVTACATLPDRVTFTKVDLAAARAVPGDPVRFWADDDARTYARWGDTLVRDRGVTPAHGMALLALSGGSDKGAYAAGLLNGWTGRGGRPEFDIVTGVSTGALIAPFAFLGSAEDASLTAIYTGINGEDVYRQRVLGGLFGGASLLDTKPLQTLIARYVTSDFLARVAAEHRRGRRLLVLTTNLDAERGVVWDMGAIAASPAPRNLILFRQILLASASIPGAFPPVMVDVVGNGHAFAEMHVDGGAIGGFFVMPRAMLEAGNRQNGPGGTIQILYNGRIDPQFAVVKPRTFGIMGRALATVLGEIDRTGVKDLKAYGADHGTAVSVCAIDDGFQVKDSTLFDPNYMRALYNYGLSVGQAGDCLARPAPSPPATPISPRRP